jgi:pimeloyl-ACP methyl ester carboxylesterase
VLAEPPVLSLFISTPPRPTELLRLFVRPPRTARVILSFTVKTAFPAMKAFRRGDDEQAIQTSTLLMTGERSPAFPLRLTDRLQRLLPNTERVEIAGASHGMPEENAKAANEAILGFLARHAPQKVG